MTSLASKERILVVGNGMVGHHFVEQLHQANENAQITVLCGESRAKLRGVMRFRPLCET